MARRASPRTSGGGALAHVFAAALAWTITAATKQFTRRQLEGARETVCDEKHSMMSPSSRSWKLASPMPHS